MVCFVGAFYSPENEYCDREEPVLYCQGIYFKCEGLKNHIVLEYAFSDKMLIKQYVYIVLYSYVT